MYLKGWAENEKAIHSLMRSHEGCSPWEVSSGSMGKEGVWQFWTLTAMFGVCFLGVIGGGKIILAIYL